MSEVQVTDFEDEIAALEAEVEQVEPEKVEAEPEKPAKADKAETTDAKEPEWKKDSWMYAQAMDEREKRQKLQAELEELKGKLKPPPEEDDVSVFEDEAAWKQKQDSKLKQEVNNVALNMAEAFAAEVFGQEKVDQAFEWYKTEGIKSPYVVGQVQSAKLPYHAMIKLAEAEKARQVDPDAMRAEVRSQLLKDKDFLKEVRSMLREESESIPPSLASKRSASKGGSEPLSDDPNDFLNP